MEPTAHKTPTQGYKKENYHQGK